MFGSRAGQHADDPASRRFDRQEATSGAGIDDLAGVGGQPSEARASTEAGRSRNRWLLGAVSAGFLIFQLVAIGLRYPYTSDEAIYLSQVNPLVPDYGWSAWRAWGMPLLAGPVALFDAPLTATRLYFATLSSVGLFLAYRPWLAVTRRPLAPVAAALFAGTAVAVYNGTLALPNYYSALAAVAATGYFVACRGDRRPPVGVLAGLAAAVALAALVRPSDSIWLVLPLGLAWLGLRSWRRPAVAVAIVAGEVAGWTVWLVEAFARFGGPLQRLHLSAQMLGGTHLYPDLDLVRLYVRLWSTGRMGAVSLDVPPALRGGAATVATVDLPSVGAGAIVWWAAASAVVVAGAVRAWRVRRDDAVAFTMPLLAGLAVAFPYLFMMRYAQLRFLLPAVGLLVIALAYGVLSVVGRRRPLPAWLGPVSAAAVAAVLIVGQAVMARPFHDAISRRDRIESAVVTRLATATVTAPCAVAGDSIFNVAYQAGCAALGTVDPSRPDQPESVTTARARGDRVVVVLRRPAPSGGFLDGWQVIAVGAAGQRPSRFIYLPPA